MICPQCGHEQASGAECERCGIIFSKWKPPDTSPLAHEEPLPGSLDAILGGLDSVRLLENPRGMLSMITGWPIAREFDIVDSVGRQRGSAAQQSLVQSAFHLRFAVYGFPMQQLAMTFHRAGFSFSEMIVEGSHGERLGSVRRRFSLLRLRYELCDAAGQMFAVVASGVWQRWELSIVDRSGKQCGQISRKWAGFTEEAIDARKFKIDFMSHPWTLPQRATILAAAVCVDFDSFEGRRVRI